MSPRRSESGAVAIEAALITPLIFIMIFGMIEFAFVLRDYVVVATDVRIGSRIASTGAGSGPGTCETGPDVPPCTPANTPALAQLAADAIQRSGSAMPQDNIDYILVYRANNKGFPGADGSTAMPSDCTGVTDCVKYVWNDSRDKFIYSGGTWISSTISACFPGNAANPLMRVGVYMKATHPMLTGLWGTTIKLTDRSVGDFEPLPSGSCNGSGATWSGGHG